MDKAELYFCFFQAFDEVDDFCCEGFGCGGFVEEVARLAVVGEEDCDLGAVGEVVGIGFDGEVDVGGEVAKLDKDGGIAIGDGQTAVFVKLHVVAGIFEGEEEAVALF